MCRRALVLLPYRDSYFLRRYGFAVRDAQIIYELQYQKHINFSEIILVNRPVSVYERFSTKWKHAFWPGLHVIDTMSLDIIGPLKKRAWTAKCYEKVFEKIVKQMIDKCFDEVFIVDFTPMAILPMVQLDRIKILYWYDMIDNFVKHNKYSVKEKELVREKYEYVKKNYHFVTGVSKEALQQLGHCNSHTLTNGVFEIQQPIFNRDTPMYDFGFIGFVTDKFDIDFVVRLSELGYKTIVYGKILDKKVEKSLKQLGVKIGGKFSYSEISSLMHQFKVGLLPYRADKSHDGSPLKLYEYLRHNRPCLTSIDYELNNEFVINYNKGYVDRHLFEKMLNISGKIDISKSITEESFLRQKVSSIIIKLLSSI